MEKMTDEQMEAMAPGEYTTWEKRVWRRGYEAAPHPPAEAQAQGDRLAIKLLVAAGYVTEAKANEALNIAHGFDKGPLAPPSAPVGVEVRQALSVVNDAANAARHKGDYASANALVRARVTLYRAALAQQPAADDVDAEQFRKGWQAGFAEGRRDQQPTVVDGAMVERMAQAVATELYGEPPPPGSNSLTRAMMLPGIKRALTAALAQPQGASHE